MENKLIFKVIIRHWLPTDEPVTRIEKSFYSKDVALRFSRESAQTLTKSGRKFEISVLMIFQISYLNHSL